MSTEQHDENQIWKSVPCEWKAHPIGEGEKLISYASLQEKEAIAFPSTSESLLGNVLL